MHNDKTIANWTHILAQLLEHQEECADPLQGAREVVEWYAANDPESNVVPADQVDAFLAWAVIK
jgi:Mlc titration factor MtfA (ptsG expression regulator)